MKTAYIELNTTEQIKSLSNKNSTDPFVYKGIHIFPSTKVTSLPDIFCENFDCIILDMGVLTNYTAIEFSKCDKQFLVCDFSQWKKDIQVKKLKDMFQISHIKRKGVILIRTFEKESTCLEFINCNIQTFPFITNPFQLSVTVVHALNMFLH